MAYTVQQFLQLDLKSVSGVDRQTTCGRCSDELRENQTGYRLGADGPRCSDCYFDELSDLLEKHPIGLPSVRR